MQSPRNIRLPHRHHAESQEHASNSNSTFDISSGDEDAESPFKPEALTSFDDIGLEGYGRPSRQSNFLTRSLCRIAYFWRHKEDRFRSWQYNSSLQDSSPRLSSNPALRWIRRFVLLLFMFFAMLGVVQFIILIFGIAMSFFPDNLEHSWKEANTMGHWPTDATRDIIPAACHSHNDYWRRVPLFDALKAGCTGVEADVWLVDEELYVGHSRSAITPNRTLHNLYVDPLVDLLEKQNPVTKYHPTIDHPSQGVFDTDPHQTLVLLIDLKTYGPLTWPYVVSHLGPLRDRGYLSYYNGTDVMRGPVTVVATGDAPFDILVANATYRDIFYDAPLDQIAEEIPHPNRRKGLRKDHGQGRSGPPIVVDRPDIYNATNSYYASVSYKKSIGYPWHFQVTSKQIDHIRAQIAGAHRRGLKVRYWGTPSWPRSLRNHIWSILEREGVDYLNVDDLKSATTQDWRPTLWDWWF